MTLAPQCVRHVIHIRLVWRARDETFQLAYQDRPCAGTLELPEHLGDDLRDGRAVVVTARFLQEELLLQASGARRAPQFSQCEDRCLACLPIRRLEHFFQHGPDLARLCLTQRGHQTPCLLLVAQAKGVDQLRPPLRFAEFLGHVSLLSSSRIADAGGHVSMNEGPVEVVQLVDGPGICSLDGGGGETVRAERRPAPVPVTWGP